MADATEATLPFGMGDVDLLSMSGVMMVVSLILGFVIFHMTDSIGSNLANRVNSFIGNLIGTNPATGDSGPEGV
jgi:hypothetical protein